MDLKEDITTMGQPSTDEERKGLKQNIIKAALNNKDLELDNQSDEQLDDLMIKTLGKGDNMNDILKDIHEALECVDGSPEDYVEAIRVHLNVKLDEAKEIYEDVLREKKDNEEMSKFHETLMRCNFLHGKMTGSYKNILNALIDAGFEIDDHYFDEPHQFIKAKRDNGKCYEVELERYSDGTYEVAVDNVHEVPCELEEAIVPPVEATVDETINAEGYQPEDQNV